ncbi:hypothetical protein RB195_010319 [Necator americanus]|uniref:Reverse transcriptase domain-containing protein n=1 Tax=Necator americanus TaxID=51031 RepID=A0ABR1CY60_NECAM
MELPPISTTLLVTGRTIGEHNFRLEAVLKRIQGYGLRVQLDKCAFLQTGITYLGFVINAQGRRSDPEKIKAIQKMPAPKDVSQLRSSLGLINFYFRQGSPQSMCFFGHSYEKGCCLHMDTALSRLVSSQSSIPGDYVIVSIDADVTSTSHFALSRVRLQ